MKTILMFFAALVLPAAIHADEQGRFVDKVELPSGQTVVVAEGDLEARSVGSFSVRLYEAAHSGDETTFFSAGLVCARDGYIERVMLSDIGGDERPEIVVIARSAGTGNYMAAYAFSYSDGKLSRVASAEGLAPEDDPVEALKSLKREE